MSQTMVLTIFKTIQIMEQNVDIYAYFIQWVIVITSAEVLGYFLMGKTLKAHDLWTTWYYPLVLYKRGPMVMPQIQLIFLLSLTEI